jgi:hypothetical protein
MALLYSTSNTNLAIFLKTKGYQLSGIEDDIISGKKIITLKGDADIDDLAELYKFGDKDDTRLKVSVKELEESRREIVGLIKGN